MSFVDDINKINATGWQQPFQMSGRVMLDKDSVKVTLTELQTWADAANTTAHPGKLVVVIGDGANNGLYYIGSIKDETGAASVIKKVGADPGELFVVVNSLPATPESGNENKIHLVPQTTTGDDNKYSEYIWTGEWEKFGEFEVSVDLSAYATKESVDALSGKLSGYTSKIDQTGETGFWDKTSGNGLRLEGTTIKVNTWRNADNFPNAVPVVVTEKKDTSDATYRPAILFDKEKFERKDSESLSGFGVVVGLKPGSINGDDLSDELKESLMSSPEYDENTGTLSFLGLKIGAGEGGGGVIDAGEVSNLDNLTSDGICRGTNGGETFVMIVVNDAASSKVMQYKFAVSSSIAYNEVSTLTRQRVDGTWTPWGIPNIKHFVDVAELAAERVIAGMAEVTPEVLDTLKNIAEWMETDTTGSAQLIEDVRELKESRAYKDVTLVGGMMNSLVSEGLYRIFGTTTDGTDYNLPEGVTGSINALVEVLDASTSSSAASITQKLTVSNNGNGEVYIRTATGSMASLVWEAWRTLGATSGSSSSAIEADTMEITASANDVEISFKDTKGNLYKKAIPAATTTSAGVMSAEDKALIFGGEKEQRLTVKINTLTRNPAKVTDITATPLTFTDASSGAFKGYEVDLTPYRGKYKSIYFRGSNFTYPPNKPVVRGVILLDDGITIESFVETITGTERTNGWQELPITENSAKLRASYCFNIDGGPIWSPDSNSGVEDITDYVELISSGDGGSSLIENVENLISRVASLEENDNDNSSINNKLNEIERALNGVPPLAVTEFSMTKYPARANGDNSASGYFKGYRLDLTSYRSTYDTVYFRGADWADTGEARICRGIIMDDDGNIESAVPFIMSKSNGWQELPLSSKSNTLWATYCTDATGGEVWTPEYVEFRSTGGSVIGDIEELESRVAVIENAGGIELFLPNDIYLLNGKTTQLFFRGFIRAVNPYNYDIKVMCAVGKTFPRYYEIEATATGDYPFRIQVRDNKLNILADKEVTLHIVDFPTIANSLNVLCVGASATATGHWPAELKRMLNEKYTMNFVGRKVGSADKSAGLEATGGWTWGTFISTGQKAIRFYINGLEGSIAAGDKLTFAGNTYTVLEINLTEGVGNIRCSGVNDYTAPVVPSVESGTLESAAGASLTVTSWEEEAFVPFYNADTQKVDFKTYADKYCSGQIDVLVVHLGVNSVLWEKSNAQNAVNTAKTFIDGFLTDFPGSKMIVSAIPLPDDGTNVYANTYSENNVNRYGTISSFMRYNHELYELVMSAEYSGKVFWAPANIFFDADYGYPKKDKAVNTRITSYTELVGTNGIHPVAQGSYMVADSMLPVFVNKAIES